MDFRILGPLEVARDGQSLRLGGAQQRALLAVLLMHRGEVLSTDRLIEELWAGRPPVTAAKTVQGYVSQLRRVLGEAAIVTRGHGYLLDVSSDEVDVARFVSLVSEGQTALAEGDAAAAQQRLQQALALWRGEPLADFAYDSFAQAEIARLQESRLAALEARIDADLALGEDSGLVAELEALVHQHPLRERLTAQLMLALYRSGRQAEALECYRGARSRLLEELGLDPGRELQELEAAILAHDPRLDSPSRGSARGPPPSARRRRGGLVIAAAGVVLLAAIAAAAVTLSASGTASLRVAANSVAVIDPRSNTVAGWAPVGTRPGAIAFGAGSLWVASVDDQTVSRVNPATLRTTRSIALDDVPTGIAASGNAIWVVESIAGASAVSVNRLDPEFDSVGPAVRIGNVVPGGPGAIAAHGNVVWVAPSSGLLTRLDPATGQIAHPGVDPNAGPTAIALDGNAVWVTDNEANNVTRIDPTGLQTSTAVNVPSGIAVGAGGVWVADSEDNAVVRIDRTTQSVTKTIAVGRSPAGIAIGAGSVWVADSGDGTVTRIDPRTNRVLARITVGGSPQAITIANGRAWVTVDAQAIGPADQTSGGGTLRMDAPFVDFMDPALAYYTLSEQLLYATCAKLLNNPDTHGVASAQLTPEVARSLPQRSADGRTYTFTIRRGFRFSPPSNKPVTAQTFKATIERTLNPRMRSPVATQFNDIVGAGAYMAHRSLHISGVTARGDTLTVRLRSPEPDFLARIAEPAMCAVPPNTPADPKGVPLIPSAGPYYVSSYTPDQSVVLLRNPNYRGSRPHHFERIEVAIGISNRQAVADVKAGTADYIALGGPTATGITSAQLALRYGAGSTAAAQGRQQYFVEPGPTLTFFYLNTHRPLFRDTRMRQAVNYAIDRRALARIGGGGQPWPERPTADYLPPGIPGATNAPVYPLTADLPKANALAHGRGQTAVLYTCEEPTCALQAQILKTELAAIGLRLDVKRLPITTLQAASAAPHRKFDLAFSGITADYPDPSAMLDFLLHTESFDDPTYRHRLTAVARLSGPARYLAYGKLDDDLARSAAPLVAVGDLADHDFFSARIGCQTHGFYGVDLAALCIRHADR